jgi:pimeloyl-ACP methyl ester carboxylesterase
MLCSQFGADSVGLIKTTPGKLGMKNYLSLGHAPMFLAGLTLTLLAASASAQTTDLPRRAVLGAQLAEIKPAPGVRIDKALPGLTAEKLGLRAGDVVTALSGTAVNSVGDIQRWLSAKAGGDPVTVELQRNSQKLTLRGALVERTREAANDAYSVTYGQVPSTRGLLRTISTSPKAPGKHPAMLFIQGVTLSSIDFPLTDANAYAQIVRAFARGGYVTVRVDKPGVGDSQGGPADTVDFVQELDGYRQALNALLARPDVDRERVFIFGHSMGGLWGPVLAAEFKLRGTVVAGTTFRTWVEYDLENSRRQSKLAGESDEVIYAYLLQKSAMNSAYLVEGLEPAAIVARNPALKELVEEELSGGMYAGRSLNFWRQVAQLNLPETWAKANGAVLALYGEADFLTAGIDHQMMADWINSKRAGTATYKLLPRSDHGFANVADQAESFKAWGKPGTQFNPNVLQAVSAWIAPLSGKPLNF